MNFLSKLKPALPTAITVVVVLVVLKLVKPYLPETVRNWLP